MWRTLMDLCRLQRLVKVFSVTVVFVLVNCLLVLRFSQDGQTAPGTANRRQLAVTHNAPQAQGKIIFHSYRKTLDIVLAHTAEEYFRHGVPPNVIHMNASQIVRKAKFEVSHTPLPPEKFNPINETYFIPRETVQNDFQFIYFTKPKCRGDLFLLIMTCSKHEHFQYRRAIRDTWGQISLYHKKIQLVFLLGQHQDQYWNENVRKEAQTFDDILITNTEESYENLTLKVLAGFNWSNKYCRADYILKSDEDMIINVPFIARLLKVKRFKNAIVGSVNDEAPVMRRNKWRVERAVYPYSLYPPYVSGNSYVVSGDAARRLLLVFRYMPLISVEDAFITGVLARVAGVSLVPDSRFTYWGTPMISVCDFLNNTMLTGTHMTPKILYRMWKAVAKRKC